MVSVSSLYPELTASISLFSCVVILISTDFDPFALVVLVVHISNKAIYLFHEATGVTSEKLTSEGVTSDR